MQQDRAFLCSLLTNALHTLYKKYMGEDEEVLKMSGPEIITKVGDKMAKVVTGVEFNTENDTVYRTYLKQFDAVQKATLEKGQNPSFLSEVKAHIHAANKQAELMMKDTVYWMMRGGIIGDAYRFVQEHLPITGGMLKKAHQTEDLMFKPSNMEKRRVAGLTTLRTPGLTLEKRVMGISNWIMGR